MIAQCKKTVLPKVVVSLVLFTFCLTGLTQTQAEAAPEPLGTSDCYLQISPLVSETHSVNCGHGHDSTCYNGTHKHTDSCYGGHVITNLSKKETYMKDTFECSHCGQDYYGCWVETATCGLCGRQAMYREQCYLCSVYFGGNNTEKCTINRKCGMSEGPILVCTQQEYANHKSITVNSVTGPDHWVNYGWYLQVDADGADEIQEEDGPVKPYDELFIRFNGTRQITLWWYFYQR